MTGNRAKALMLIVAMIAVIFSLALLSYLSKKKDAIHIAFAGPASGRNARAGALMIRAIELYLDEINQSGGVNGKKVILDIWDDQDNADRARECALKMVDEDRALAVIGHWSGASSISAGAIYKKREIPAVTPGAIDMDVTRDNEWYFRTIYNADSAGRFLANYIKKVQGRDTAALIHEDGAYRDLARSFEKTAAEVGLAVTLSREFKVGDEGLDRRLENIVHELGWVKDPGVIVMPVQSAEAVTLVTLVRDAGIRNPVVGPPSFSEERFLLGFLDAGKTWTNADRYTNGVHVMTPLLFDTANKEAQELKRRYEYQHPEETLDWPVAFAHDSAKVIVEAMMRSDVQGRPETRKEDRRKIRRFLASLNSPENAVKGAAGLIYFDEHGDAQRSISMGVFKRNKIISSLTQLRTVRKSHGFPVSEPGVEKERVIAHGGKKIIKTRVVYTGMNIEKVDHFDLNALTFRLEGWLWFRFEGERDVGDVEFLNAVELEKSDPPFKRSDGRRNYIRYKLNGTFEMDYHRPRRPFGIHNLGVSFRHRTLTEESILYVRDELGMGWSDSASFLEKLRKKHVFSSFHGWSPNRIHFFQDTMLVESLGDIAYIDLPRDAPAYSRFNFNLELSQNILSLRGTMSHGVSMVVAPLILLGILLAALAGRWRRFARFPKTLWFLQLLLWSLLLLSAEALILHSMRSRISDFYLEHVLLTFDVLWFVNAAVFVKKAIEQFVWIPLEARTGRTIPTLVRRMAAFSVYLLAFFGIVAFAFKYKLTGLLATSGLLAMIIGLAVQMNISNIFCGIALSLERPFRIGDWIRINDMKGKVVNMTWRSTRIQTSFENVISIPNSAASETIVENYYFPENLYWEGFTVHIDPIHPPARVEKLLHDAVLSTTDVLEPWVLFAGVNEWSAIYWVYFSAEEYGSRWEYRRDVWKNVWVHLNNAGIDFAIKDRKRHQFRQKDATREEPLAILEEIDLFQAFPDAAKLALSRQVGRLQFSPGEIVIREGDEGDSLFIIVEGVVGVWTESETGEQIEIIRRGAGDVIGEMALLTGEARTATVKAATDSILYEITKSDIAPLLKSQPKIVERLSTILAERKIETQAARDENRALDEMKKSIRNKFLYGIQRFFGLKRGGNG